MIRFISPDMHHRMPAQSRIHTVSSPPFSDSPCTLQPFPREAVTVVVLLDDSAGHAHLGVTSTRCFLIRALGGVAFGNVGEVIRS